MAQFGTSAWRRALLIGSVLGVLGMLGGAAVAAGGRTTGMQRRLDDARTRWSARPFSHYRMLIAEDHGRCFQDVEVDGERVMRRTLNSCRSGYRTIGSLFKLIDGTRSAVYRCVDHGCACDTVMTARALYDPAFGYPLEISFSWEVRANWRHPDFWKQLIATGGLPKCRNTTFNRTFAVLSLTPLP